MRRGEWYLETPFRPVRYPIAHLDTIAPVDPSPLKRRMNVLRFSALALYCKYILSALVHPVRPCPIHTVIASLLHGVCKFMENVSRE